MMDTPAEPTDDRIFPGIAGRVRARVGSVVDWAPAPAVGSALPRPLQFVAACGTVLLAALLLRVTDSLWGGSPPMVSFTVPVIVSAYLWGGFGGTVATVVAVIASVWLGDPTGVFWLARTRDRMAVALLVLAGTTISSLVHRLQATRAAHAAQAMSLRRAERIKEEFLATLSHELRTPLNAILGYATMARNNISRPDRALEVIERNGRVLKALVEDLIDISRITRGEIAVTFAPVAIRELINEAVATIEPAAAAKTIALDTCLDDAGQVSVFGDAVRLRQVLDNVLSNAVKFTDPGGRITVEATRSRAGRTLTIVVADTGVGMAPEGLADMFEPFWQADSSATRQHSGLGLGLAIARRIADMHGASLTASSGGVGRGTRVEFALPVAADAGARTDASRSA